MSNNTITISSINISSNSSDEENNRLDTTAKIKERLNDYATIEYVDGKVSPTKIIEIEDLKYFYPLSFTTDILYKSLTNTTTSPFTVNTSSHEFIKDNYYKFISGYNFENVNDITKYNFNSVKDYVGDDYYLSGETNLYDNIVVVYYDDEDDWNDKFKPNYHLIEQGKIYKYLGMTDYIYDDDYNIIEFDTDKHKFKEYNIYIVDFNIISLNDLKHFGFFIPSSNAIRNDLDYYIYVNETNIKHGEFKTNKIYFYNWSEYSIFFEEYDLFENTYFFDLQLNNYYLSEYNNSNENYTINKLDGTTSHSFTKDSIYLCKSINSNSIIFDEVDVANYDFSFNFTNDKLYLSKNNLLNTNYLPSSIIINNVYKCINNNINSLEFELQTLDNNSFLKLTNDHYMLFYNNNNFYALNVGDVKEIKNINNENVHSEIFNDYVNNNASGNYSTALGFNTLSSNDFMTSIGKYNENKTNNLFEIGNGINNNRKNIFSVDISGNTLLNNISYIQNEFHNSRCLLIDDVIDFNYFIKSFNSHTFYISVSNCVSSYSNDYNNHNFNKNYVYSYDTSNLIFNKFNNNLIFTTIAYNFTDFETNKIYTPQYSFSNNNYDVENVNGEHEEYIYENNYYILIKIENNTYYLKQMLIQKTFFNFDFTNNKYYLSCSNNNNPDFIVDTNKILYGHIYKCISNIFTNLQFQELPEENYLIISLSNSNYMFIYDRGWKCINVGNVNLSDIKDDNLNIKNSEIFNNSNSASGIYSHAEGFNNSSSGNYSHAEGKNNNASGENSHVEGLNNIASGISSHAEGKETISSGLYSHSEGYGNSVYGIASGDYSHSEGYYTTASGDASHAEGRLSIASNYYSHAEGFNTNASGMSSHTEGTDTIASNENSHAGGEGTIADQKNQTSVGKFNTSNNTDALFVVGNGTANNSRSDALVVKSNGNTTIQNTLTTKSIQLNNFDVIFNVDECKLFNPIHPNINILHSPKSDVLNSNYTVDNVPNGDILKNNYYRYNGGYDLTTINVIPLDLVNYNSFVSYGNNIYKCIKSVVVDYIYYTNLNDTTKRYDFTAGEYYRRCSDYGPEHEGHFYHLTIKEIYKESDLNAFMQEYLYHFNTDIDVGDNYSVRYQDNILTLFNGSYYIYYDYHSSYGYRFYYANIIDKDFTQITNNNYYLSLTNTRIPDYYDDEEEYEGIIFVKNHIYYYSNNEYEEVNFDYFDFNFDFVAGKSYLAQNDLNEYSNISKNCIYTCISDTFPNFQFNRILNPSENDIIRLNNNKLLIYLNNRWNSLNVGNFDVVNNSSSEIFNDYNNNVSSGNYSSVSGYNNNSSSDYSTVIGKFNKDEEDSLFVIGNGNNNDNRNNALVVKNDGSLKCNDIDYSEKEMINITGYKILASMIFLSTNFKYQLDNQTTPIYDDHNLIYYRYWVDHEAGYVHVPGVVIYDVDDTQRENPFSEFYIGDIYHAEDNKILIEHGPPQSCNNYSDLENITSMEFIYIGRYNGNDIDLSSYNYTIRNFDGTTSSDTSLIHYNFYKCISIDYSNNTGIFQIVNVINYDFYSLKFDKDEYYFSARDCHDTGFIPSEISKYNIYKCINNNFQQLEFKQMPRKEFTIIDFDNNYIFMFLNDRWHNINIGYNMTGREILNGNYNDSTSDRGEIFNNYYQNEAWGLYSHAEGSNNKVYCSCSHAEGSDNVISIRSDLWSGSYSHVEGRYNKSLAFGTHVGGYYNVADHDYMYVVGKYNIYNQNNPSLNENKLLVVGNGTNEYNRSDAFYVKSDGDVVVPTKLSINNSKSITNTTASNSSSYNDDGIITTKYYTDTKLNECVKYYEVNKIIEFSSSLTYSNFTNDYIYLSYSTVNNITISGYTRNYKKYYAYKCSIDGNNNISFQEIELNNNIIVKNLDTKQEYYYFVINNTPYLKNLSAGGEFNINGGEVFNDYTNNQATGEYSHAEGYNNQASGDDSHCEGISDKSTGDCSHCEGANNLASGHYSHCEGHFCIASGWYSHAGCYYTRADQNYQTSIGKYNKTGNTNSLFSVGNGTADNSRSDAFNVFSDGTININDRFNIYVGPITLRLEYNATYNNYHSSFGVIYSWRDGNHKVCILSNARVLLPRMTFTTQKIFVSNLYDGRTTDGITGFKNQYNTLYNIDSALGGGFVKVGHFYQLIEGSSGIGALHSYNANAYELTVNFVENDYPALFFDNCWFCIKNYYSS